jgi:hypothetical protein
MLLASVNRSRGACRLEGHSANCCLKSVGGEGGPHRLRVQCALACTVQIEREIEAIVF